VTRPSTTQDGQYASGIRFGDPRTTAVLSSLVGFCHLIDGFTKRYNVNRLVYCEEAASVWDAIEREKQIKGWTRERKIELIESVNPGWHDLADPLFAPTPAPDSSYLRMTED